MKEGLQVWPGGTASGELTSSGEPTGQPHPSVIAVDDEDLPLPVQNPPELQKRKYAEHDNETISNFEESLPANLPLSDPISLFSCDDANKGHSPHRHAKRTFEEVSLDLQAGLHGSPDYLKRRNAGPPRQCYVGGRCSLL